MKHIVFGLLVIFSIPAFASDLIVLHDLAAGWVPDILKFTCSGFIIENQTITSQQDSERTLISANHCRMSSDPTHKFDVIENPENHLTVRGIFGVISGSSRTEVPVARLVSDLFYQKQDILVLPIREKEFLSTTSLKLAEHLPIIGQQVIVKGFPGYVQSTLKCVYEGPTLGYNDRFKEIILSHKINCPDLSGTAAGVSGGPVLNLNGKVVGVATNYNTRQTSGAVIYFSDLTLGQTAEPKVTFTKAVDPFSPRRLQLSITFDQNRDIQHVTVIDPESNQRDEMYFSNGMPSSVISYNNQSGKPIKSTPLINPR